MKNPTKSCKTSFQTADGPKHVPHGGFPSRDRCLSESSAEERQAAVKLLQNYRSWEAVAAEHDIEGKSHQLAKLSRESQTGLGGLPGELLRRTIRQADPAKFDEAQGELAKLRQEALALIRPYLSRLIASLDESLSASALEAEKRLEAEGFPLIAGDKWALHSDSVCAALWSRRIIVERTLAEVEPNSAIGAVQHLLCSEALKPSTPFSWPA